MSDWSSDVCSSDLNLAPQLGLAWSTLVSIFWSPIGICWIGLGDALTIIWPCLARKREPIYRLVSLAKEEGPWRNVTFKPLRRAAVPICRLDRNIVGSGKSVYVRLELGGDGI